MFFFVKNKKRRSKNHTPTGKKEIFHYICTKRKKETT